MDLADKTIAFDPLDREIPSEDSDHMTKRDELLKKLEEDMFDHKIDGKLLNSPMQNETHQILMTMFDKAEKDCRTAADQYLSKAKSSESTG